MIMKVVRQSWDTVLPFIGVGVLAVIVGILVHHLTRRPEVFSRIAQADRVVVYEQDKPELRITYTGVELSQIIEAIHNSRRDNKAYDTIVNIVMDFYKGPDEIATIYTRSDFIIAGGRKYRAPGYTLSRLVDSALQAAANQRARGQNEDGP